ncbi:antitoxin Xre/MbcA/ParS toxin-binding domain-containing protein [Mesorhizobium helmanticense]|uniref:Uncharacterized protein n=1 Tax=Mesorhizobium helmanticense TaxID=1776423 RepID=A0A2T4INR4_9HYPH|nr:antitoxin Xre/MbcA/ParS toxin-binding domain-containing protein [Mesorhizobium helmanticense]PTE07272.1 hypothetical protein C9427_26545 [Mesorhizobium helmanticense]
MTKPWNCTDPTHQTGVTHQTGFARAVAVEVEQALLRRDKIKNGDAVVAGQIAGAVAAAIVLLAPGDLQAIDTTLERLPGIVLQFVRALAAEATSREPVASASGAVQVRSRLAGNDDIDLMRVEDWAGRVAGPTFLEENFGISRSTLHRWQRSGKVVALRTGGRKHVFPLAQFVDGRPAPGIGEVLSSMPNPRRAWSWLISPAAGLDGRIPIEMLKQDLVADVVLAAQGTLTAKFE